MTYIKLEDVQKIFNKCNISSENGILKKINSLPSVSFEEMIKEMIEEMRNKEYMYDLDMVKIDALQELLNKLPK